MKLSLVYLFVLSGLFLFVSCSNSHKEEKGLVDKKGILYRIGSDKPFTGTEKAVEKNRILEYDVVNGKKNGRFKISYMDGNPQMIGNMKDNKNVGLWQYFYPDSILESQGHFENDSAEGKWMWYYPNGKIKEVGYFSRGISQGVWTEYDSSGNVASKSFYKNGKKVSVKKYQIKRIKQSDS